ncbi:MAG: hypothetical protein EXQ77_05930 [Thermoleophilia bacterium]|nr:hypothetical protein [Thermoleophilia bacterium]
MNEFSGQGERAPRRLGRFLAPLVLLGGLALKFGSVVKVLGLVVAIGGYALLWGIEFALGFVLLLLAHELGHYMEARRQGLDPGLPVFVPFVGAYVALRNRRFDPWIDARVSLAGPVVGGVAALGCLAAGTVIDSALLRALAYTGFFLNLANLLPVWVLDGRHVLRAWRVLRRGGGRPRAAEARRLATVVAVVALGTAGALALGMLVAHVPQDRL